MLLDVKKRLIVRERRLQVGESEFIKRFAKTAGRGCHEGYGGGMKMRCAC